MLNSGVEILFVFPNGHYIHIRMAGVDKGIITVAAPSIGIKPQGFPKGNVQAFIPTALRGGDWPLKEYFVLFNCVPGGIRYAGCYA